MKSGRRAGQTVEGDEKEELELNTTLTFGTDTYGYGLGSAQYDSRDPMHRLMLKYISAYKPDGEGPPNNNDKFIFLMFYLSS